MKKIETKMNSLNFLDFCSGIGGGRIGLENLGMNCLGFSEIDKDVEITYREFFGDDEVNYGGLVFRRGELIIPDELVK